MSLAMILEQHGRDVVQARPGMSVGEVVALLADNRIGAVPVVDGERVVGIFSERDMVYALRRDGAGVLAAPVEQVMTAPAISAEPSTSPIAALSLMTRRRIRHLPVLAEGRLIGFVSIGDLVKARIELIEQEAEAMRSYIAG